MHEECHFIEDANKRTGHGLSIAPMFLFSRDAKPSPLKERPGTSSTQVPCQNSLCLILFFFAVWQEIAFYETLT